MSDPLLLSRRGRVGLITFNAPAQRNALDLVLCRRLSDALRDLEQDATVQALVLHGGAHFCAGGKVDSFGEEPLAMRTAMLNATESVRRLTSGRLPAVAAVEGSAYGAGFSLALACDFIVGDETASFCAAFARVALVPDFGMMWTLPQRIGSARARELLMLAEPVRGAAAQALGLIDRFVPTGTVLQAALELAERLADAPSGSIAATKAFLGRAPASLDAALAWEADTQSMLARTEDFREGVAAFKGKRPPHFRGK